MSKKSQREKRESRESRSDQTNREEQRLSPQEDISQKSFRETSRENQPRRGQRNK